MKSLNKQSHITRALVIETNNLEGGDGHVVSSLQRLLEHLRYQTLPLSELRELVITHGGITPKDQAALEKAAGRSILFVQVPDGTSYYEAKNIGFEATTAEVVAFGDSDCWPVPEWLERLFQPFTLTGPDGQPIQVVAGRTTYRGDLLGIAATTIDFMYFQSPLAAGCTRNFYANNVAFRREGFAARKYAPAPGMYRGHCQILGFRLSQDSVPIIFEPQARTIHRFPDSGGELVHLRLLRGSDTVELTPHLAASCLSSRWRWLGHLGPVSPVVVLAMRLGYSLRSLGHQDMPDVQGLAKLVSWGSDPGRDIA